MTELFYTAHARQRMKEYEISADDVWEMFCNSEKCVVPQSVYIKKQMLHHHGPGRILYRYGDWILVIAQKIGVANKFLLITIFPATCPDKFKVKK